ncbi:protein spaetzle 5-like [Euwallacea fornicatus]|uniref:protein spaetzle 5-like n=1 Tax=Euwallacea fornicatus TaxID=995702 RepID=UPI00338FDC83
MGFNSRTMRLAGLCLWLILNWVKKSDSVCTPEYGPNPACKFIPAPPGKTPPCARPGLTYCEHPENYPGEIIFQLIQKWQFDHKTLIIDEAKEEFNTVYFPPPSTVYGPPSFGQNHIQGNDGGYHYPQPIYIPKPPQSFSDQGGFYLPPKPLQPELSPHNFSLGFNGYPDYNKDGSFLTYKYTSNFPQNGGSQYNPFQSPIFAPPTYTHLNDIWKRNERLKRSLRHKRAVQFASKYPKAHLSNSTALSTHLRAKRQATITGQTLCRSRSNYIMPRAALNSKGNWMYVVNMPETNQQYTQLVKSEMCADTNCNGLCQLPQGYSSRCEQKYVQKRLIALEGSGSDLYSDIFWFPSCCICTVSNT